VLLALQGTPLMSRMFFRWVVTPVMAYPKN
jgi:hypothetical protein